MPTNYLSIRAQQSPFVLGVDKNGRTIFGCNFVAHAHGPIADLKNEIAALLDDASLITARGTDYFVGPFAKLPDGDGPYVTLTPTPGFAPAETHDGSRYEFPGFQVLVTAQVYSEAETRAWAIHRLLDAVTNQEVTALP